MSKINNFLIKIMPSKRKLIQLYAALLYNANLKGFVTGEIFKGKSKALCLPGMNCYSCPGAIGACPLGTLQNALAASDTKSITYVIGILCLYGIIFGRTICGWFCPGGLLQELLYKIKTPKLKKNKLTRILSYFKYVLLVVLCIGIPILYGASHAIPAFCKYICPIGTFEGAVFLLANKNNASYFGMLGYLFTWKFALLLLFILASIFIYRFFCRFFCPLGALYGIFNRLAILGIKVNKDKCTSCGSCISHCKMDVKEVGDHECIMCGECKSVCSAGAINWTLVRKDIEESKTSEDKATEAVVKNKLKKKDLWTYIVGGAMLVSLAGVMVYANVDWNKSTKLNLNDTATFDIETNQGSMFSSSKEDGVTVLYFYSSYDDEKMNDFALMAGDGITLLAVSCPSHWEENKSKVNEELPIVYGFDSNKNPVLGLFSEEGEYSYYVWLDSEDKVMYMSSLMPSTSERLLITASASGKTIGKEVGDVCLAMDIHLKDKNGNTATYNIAENRGKVIVLNFWGIYCGPCKEELPYFDQVYSEFKDSIDVIAIHDGATYEEESYMDYLTGMFEDYSLSFGYEEENCQYFKALGGGDTIPMTVIIDANGIVTYNSLKALTYEELKSLVLQAMN